MDAIPLHTQDVVIDDTSLNVPFHGPHPAPSHSNDELHLDVCLMGIISTGCPLQASGESVTASLIEIESSQPLNESAVSNNTPLNVPSESPIPEMFGHNLATPLRTPVDSCSSIEKMSLNLLSVVHSDEIKKKYSISYSSIMQLLINDTFKVLLPLELTS